MPRRHSTWRRRSESLGPRLASDLVPRGWCYRPRIPCARRAADAVHVRRGRPLWAAGMSKEDTGHAAQPAAADARSRRRVSRIQKLPDCKTPCATSSRFSWTVVGATGTQAVPSDWPAALPEPRGPRASPLLPRPPPVKINSRLVCWSELCLNRRLDCESSAYCRSVRHQRTPAFHLLLVTSSAYLPLTVQPSTARSETLAGACARFLCKSVLM